MKILGIETSCDETSASVVEGSEKGVKVLSNIVSSQIDIHKKYGGVIPEIAAREHVTKIIPVIDEALTKADCRRRIAPLLPNPWKAGPRPAGGGTVRCGTETGKNNSEFHIPNSKLPDIDAIAVAVGPGLITSLMVGVETAKTLAFVWNIPLVAVNHIEGHIYANFIREIPNIKFQIPNKSPNHKSQITNNFFPAVILTVSGGHTSLVLMKGHGKLKVVGDTRDDAAGEAFDKAAKMMDLGYPGGPIISEYAERQKNKSGIGNQELGISLPRPMLNSQSLDFSFSGLKTALLYALQKDKNRKKKIPQYCAEFQQAVIDVLIAKTIKAVKKYSAKTIMLSGGVASNKELRKQMQKKLKSEFPDSFFLVPELDYCTDNAAMIATTGYYKALDKKFTPWQKIKTDCNQKL